MATHTVNELQSFSRSAACITGSPRTTFHNHFYNILGPFRMLWFAIQRTSQITIRSDDSQSWLLRRTNPEPEPEPEHSWRMFVLLFMARKLWWLLIQAAVCFPFFLPNIVYWLLTPTQPRRLYILIQVYNPIQVSLAALTKLIDILPITSWQGKHKIITEYTRRAEYHCSCSCCSFT